MRTEAIVRSGSTEFHIVGTVRGLASEAARVEQVMAHLQPAGVALGVGPEDLDGLRQLQAGTAYEHEFSEADEVYAAYLEQFGAVALPPPDLVAAVRLADAGGKPVVALDLPEVAYVEAFTQEISGFQLLRYNRRIRKLARKPPAVEDAMGFHLWWDAQVSRLDGFARLERRREGHMAAALRTGTWPPGRVLVLVEAARVEGLVRSLEASLSATVQP